MRRIALTLVLLFPVACDDIGHVVVNRGEVCLDREQVLQFKQTGDLQLRVKLDCESACMENAEAICDASIDGPIITLESQFIWSVPDDKECVARCEDFAATCTVPQTYPGQYTLVHGDEKFLLDLPSNPLLDCLTPMTEEEAPEG